MCARRRRISPLVLLCASFPFLHPILRPKHQLHAAHGWALVAPASWQTDAVTRTRMNSRERHVHRLEQAPAHDKDDGQAGCSWAVCSPCVRRVCLIERQIRVF